MKKVLSFVLVLAMILGSVSMAFAAPVTAIAAGDKVDATNTVLPFADAEDNAVATVLRDLGVVDGDSDGNANLEDGLTRAEAAALIVKAWGLGDQGAVQTTTKFADVKKTDWFSGYVAVAAANGFVDGSNGKFNPNGKLTMDEAVTLVYKAMGFDAAHLEGTWPTNYRDLAMVKTWVMTQDINTDAALKTSVKTGTQAATRGDLFNLIYNCIKSEEKLYTWKEVVTNGLISGEYSHSANALNLIQKITRKTDKFTNGLKYTYDYVPSFESAAYEFVNGFDASKYNGYPIVVIKKDGNAIGVAKVATVTTVKGTFAKASSNDFTTFTAIDGTVYTLKKTNDTKAFINGKQVNNFAVDKTTVYTLNITCNAKTPTKNATVSSIHYEQIDATVMANATDVALFANENLYRMITASALKENGGMTPAFKNLVLTSAGLTKNAVLDPDTPLVIEGAATKLSEIQKNDIVEIYYYGGNSANGIAKMVVTRNVVTGAVTGYSKTGYTVNGVEYKYATTPKTYVTESGVTFKNLDNAVKGASEYALYLNAAGKIAYAKLTAAPVKYTTRYAFVLTANTTDNWTNSGKGWKAASNMAITLLPLDTMVAEEYAFISSAALKSKSDVVATETNYTWKDVVTNTDSLRLVSFTNSGETLKSIYTVTLSTNTGLKNAFIQPEEKTVTFTATKLDGVSYFKNAKIYTVATNTNVTFASEAAYKAVEVADMVKKTTNNFIYKLNANGYVDTVIVQGYTYDNGEKTGVTVAAITGIGRDGDGQYVTFVQPGGEEEKLYATPNALGTPNVTSLYTIKVKDGKVSKVEQASVLGTAKEYSNNAICKLLAYDGEALTSDGGFELALNPTVKFMYYNEAVDAKCLANVTDFDEINKLIAKADKLTIYQGYSLYDLVVIDLPSTYWE